MEQLIGILLGCLGTIVTAISGFIVAYFHKKTRQLEGKVKDKEVELAHFHNGFKSEIYNRLGKVEEDISAVLSFQDRTLKLMEFLTTAVEDREGVLGQSDKKVTKQNT